MGGTRRVSATEAGRRSLVETTEFVTALADLMREKRIDDLEVDGLRIRLGAAPLSRAMALLVDEPPFIPETESQRIERELREKEQDEKLDFYSSE